jgi:hypothetical protein
MPHKAGARLLYQTISASERIAGLGAKGALIYTWLLAHADDQGRYAGGARKVKIQVVPLIDEISEKEVESTLAAMAKVHLVIRYSGGGTQLVQITDWWEFQAGLRFKFASRYPAPEGWKDQVKQPPERNDVGRFKPPLGQG